MVVLETLIFFSIAQGLSRVLGLMIQALGSMLALGVVAEPVPAAVGYQDAVEHVADPKASPFVYEPGAAVPAIRLPRAERLSYRAYLDLSIVSTSVGKVTQTTLIENQRPSVLLVQPKSSTEETATVTLQAKGGYAWYDLESTIQSRLLPQEWPRILYTTESVGSERRRREILVGLRDGVLTSSYRRDTEKGAPERTRIWREAVSRPVPEGTLDMLTSLFMVRTLIREGKDEIVFPLIDKDRVWQLRISKGKARCMETPAGTFDVVEVVLDPGPYPGEEFKDDRLGKFEGVFGIHGTIHLWAEKHSGVAVRIQGDLPVGPVTLGIDVILDSYSGTPSEFVPVRAEK